MTLKEPVEKQWQTLLALVLSALGIVLSLFEALAALLLGSLSAVPDSVNILTTVPVGLLAWSSILSALLLAPVFLLNLFNLQGKAVPKWLDTSRPGVGKIALLAISVWPVVAFLGWWLNGFPQAAGYLLGPINVLVTGLPVLWIYTISQWKLSSGAQTWKWNLFGFSFIIMPPVVIFVEIIVLAGIAAIAGLVFIYRNSNDVTLEFELNAILTQISRGSGDMDTTLLLLKPYLLRPAVIFTVLAIFSGVIPVIEETLKPAALWLMAGKEIRPREGFVAGLISGAAFALMENLLFFSSAWTAEEWLVGAISRSTTGVLHMLGSGLVGWGLAKAWQEGKWAFLGRNMIIAILFHGLWNALAVFAGIAPIYVFGLNTTIWQNFLFYLPLIILLVLAFIVLLLINRRFRREQANEINDVIGSDEIPGLKGNATG